MNEWIIYWILKLDTLRTISTAVSTLSFTIIIICISIGTYWKLKEPYRYREKTATGDPSYHFTRMKNNFLAASRKGFIISITLFLISFFPATFLPSTKQACAIFILPKIINNEHIQNIPNNFSKLANEKLTEWINEIKDTKQEPILQP